MTPIRMVVAGLIAVLVLCVVAIAALAFNSSTIPDVLQNVAVGSLTGLVGLLVPAKFGTKDDDPAPF